MKAKGKGKKVKMAQSRAISKTAVYHNIYSKGYERGFAKGFEQGLKAGFEKAKADFWAQSRPFCK